MVFVVCLVLLLIFFTFDRLDEFGLLDLFMVLCLFGVLVFIFVNYKCMVQ